MGKKTNQESRSANPLKTCRFRPIESLEIDHSALDVAMWSMVEFEKRNILSLYRADIHKFAGALREKVASIFSEIPAQLSKHEKKFTVSAITANARIRDFDGAFEWLKGAMTVNICYGASEPNKGCAS